MDKTDTPTVPVRRVILCMSVCVAIALPISAWFWVHAMGWRSTRVVESIKIYDLLDRYTIDARSERVMVGWDCGPLTATQWHDAQTVRYQRWRVVSVDGFKIEFPKVDPFNPPNIKRGEKYTGWWK